MNCLGDRFRDLLSHLPGPEMTPLITTRRLPNESTPLIPASSSSTNDDHEHAHAHDNDEKPKPKPTHTLTKTIDEKTLSAPKTPVTVQSTFDDAFRREGDRGGGLSGEGVGGRVDVKVVEGEKVGVGQVEGEQVEDGGRRLGNRRGVGPGIT